MSFLRGRAPEFDLAEALVSYAYRIPQTPSMDDMDEEGNRFVGDVLVRLGTVTYSFDSDQSSRQVARATGTDDAAVGPAAAGTSCSAARPVSPTPVI